MKLDVAPYENKMKKSISYFEEALFGEEIIKKVLLEKEILHWRMLL